MKLNDSVGPYRLVYKRNDPMAGEVWVFQRGLVCVEWKPGGIPTIEDLDLKYNGKQ